MLEIIVKILAYTVFIIAYVKFVFWGEAKDGIFAILGILFVLSVHIFAITAKVCVD